MIRYMTTVALWAVSMFLLFSAMSAANAQAFQAAPSESLYTLNLRNIDGFDVPMANYKGRVVLVVNTASQSGYTPQFTSLEKLHNRYNNRGLSILAFPTNDFSAEEPGSNAEIRTFTTMNYGISFDLFAKTSTRGDDASPLFVALTASENPLIGGPITGSFTKFLIGKDGRVIARFAPSVDPNAPEVRGIIEKALAE